MGNSKSTIPQNSSRGTQLYDQIKTSDPRFFPVLEDSDLKEYSYGLPAYFWLWLKAVFDTGDPFSFLTPYFSKLDLQKTIKGTYGAITGSILITGHKKGKHYYFYDPPSYQPSQIFSLSNLSLAEVLTKLRSKVLLPSQQTRIDLFLSWLKTPPVVAFPASTGMSLGTPVVYSTSLQPMPSAPPLPYS